MLDLMRRHSRSWLIKVLLGTVIVVFVFFYGWSYMERKAGLIASINGTDISVKAYEESLRTLMENFRQKTPNPMSEETSKEIRKLALDSLIHRILLLQEARRFGLAVSEEELKDHIRRLPAFQTDGRFDRTLYLRLLQSSRIGPNEFETDQREHLLLSKLEKLVTDTVQVSDQEVLDSYVWSQERISLSFLEIDPSSFKGLVAPSTEELFRYFNDHRDQFKTAPKVKAEFLLFDPGQYRKQVQIDDREIRQMYEWNQEKYRTPEKVTLRHILIKTLPTDDAQKRTTALKKAEEALEKIKRGEDFAKVAMAYSEDPATSKSGGYLGSVHRGQILKPIEEVAFSLKKGEVSRIVKSPYGFHILKADEIQESRTRSLEEVQASLKEEAIQERAKERASREAEKAFIALMKKATMEGVAQQFHVPLIRTPLFPEGGRIPGQDLDEAFYRAAFETKANEIHDPVESNGKFYIIKVIESHPSRIPEFGEVQHRVREAYVEEKGKDIAGQKAKGLIERIGRGEPLERIAKEVGVPVKTTELFGRLHGGQVPSIGYSEALAKEAFSLSRSNPLLGTPHWVDTRWIVAMLKERKGIDQTAFEQEKRIYALQLLQYKRRGFFQE